MKKIAVFASGNGTNLEAIIRHIRKGTLAAKLVLVVSDRKDAFALKRARKAGIPAVAVEPREFSSRQSYEEHLLGLLRKAGVGLVVLAGFMRILSPFFVNRYRNKILNIHPALLPAFKGVDAIGEAYRYGVKVTGVTVHFVDEKMDHGPIVAQEAVAIRDGESLASLEARIHRVEHEIYSEAIGKVLRGKVSLRGRRVVRV